MAKKITAELLESLHSDANIIDSLLDEQLTAIEDEFAGQYTGLGNRILTLFVSENGQRVQQSEKEIVQELREKRQVDQRVVYRILERLEQHNLIRCTYGGRYELSNNVLAQHAFRKVEAENRNLRKIRNTISDRMSRNEQLDAKYLNYISGFLPILELSEEEVAFVKRSQDTVRRRKRTAQVFYAVILALLLALASWALKQSYSTEEANEKLKTAIVDLEEAKNLAEAAARQSEIDEAIANRASQRADSLRQVARRNEANALQQADLARQFALLARIQRDSAETERQRAEQQAELARKSAKAYADAAREASAQRRLAEKAREDAIAATERVREFNKVVVAINAATRSIELEDPRLKALVARQAFSLVQKSRFDTLSSHPFLYSGLYYALKTLVGNDRTFADRQHDGGIQDIHVQADEQGRFTLYTAGSDGSVKRWTLQNARWPLLGRPDMQVEALPVAGGGVHNAIDISTDGRFLLIAGELDYLQIYDLEQEQVVLRKFLPKDFGEVFNCTFLGAGYRQVAAIGRTRLLVWQDSVVKQYPYNGGPERTAISRAEIMGQHNLVAGRGFYQSGFYNFKLDIFAPLMGEAAYPFSFSVRGSREEYNYGRMTATAIKEIDKGRAILVQGFQNGQILVIETALSVRGQLRLKQKTQRVYSTFKPHQASITQITFDDTGHYFAVGSLDGTASVWDYHKLDDPAYQPLILDDQEGWVLALAFVPNTSTLIVGDQTGQLHYWPLDPNLLAAKLCEQLRERGSGPAYDRLESEEWRRFFGDLEPEPACAD